MAACPRDEPKWGELHGVSTSITRVEKLSKISLILLSVERTLISGRDFVRDFYGASGMY